MRILALLLVACSSSAQVDQSTTPSSQDEDLPAVAAAATVCPATEFAALVQATGLSEVVGEHTEPAEYAADLDGDGSPERVLHIREVIESEEYGDGTLIKDHLVAFACAAGTWTESARTELTAEEDNGTFDCETGVTGIEIERVVDVDVLVVQTQSCQGSADPRWYEERVTILSQRESELAQVFSCAAVDQNVSGPCRAGTSTRRTIEIDGPRIVVEATRGYDQGVCDDEESEEADAPPEESVGAYAWNGMEFVAAADVCGMIEP